MSPELEEHAIPLDEPQYGPPVISLPNDDAAAAADRLRRRRQKQHLAKIRSLTPYNICCMAFKTFSLVVILSGIIFVTFWAILQPDPLRVHVEGAHLIVFNLSGAGAGAGNSTTLSYDIFLNLTLRNPNKKLSIRYERVDADARFAGFAFASRRLPRFRQRKKNSLPVTMEMAGEAPASGGVAEEFGREEKEGFFSVGVKLYTVVRLRFWFFDSVEYRPEISCELRMPAPGKSTSVAARFNRTSCDAEGFH